MATKYIVVTGGVCSSLGKGLTAASIALLLEAKGFVVAMLKFDPYLNIDPGTMSPYQHGEVYVTDDGAETDLDLGHYARFTNSPLSRVSNVTSGQIYNSVIRRERKGDYLGKTVQVIPHITDEIKQRIYACAKQSPNIDIVIVEIGGTVGDIESLPFLEAVRQFTCEHRNDCINIHLTYVPYLKAAGEIKTKPSQHSVQVLREIGIFPDIIICRCEVPLNDDVKDKISLFCNVPRSAVIEEIDVAHSIYEVPLQLLREKIDEQLCQLLHLPYTPSKLSDWEQLVHKIKATKESIRVAIIGKYVQHKDAYKSVFESLSHAAMHAGYRLEIACFEADKLPASQDEIGALLQECDGCLIPGGFGERGWEGKIQAAKYCREHHLPYFGICLGMQVLCVEFARHVLHLPSANSTEIDPQTPHPVISLLSEQKGVQDLGGTMRLGAYRCVLKPNTRAHKAYKTSVIEERHRHRYEYNPLYQAPMEQHGFLISGTTEGEHLCEIVELESHPWMVGVQFHPEFKSKPTAPHPLFMQFMQAMIAHRTSRLSQHA